MRLSKLLAATALAFNLILTSAVSVCAQTVVIADEAVAGAELPEAMMISGTKIELPDYSFRIAELFDGYLVVKPGEEDTEIHFASAYMNGEESLLMTIEAIEDADVEDLTSGVLLAIKGSTSYVLRVNDIPEELQLSSKMIEQLKSAVKKSFTVVIGE